MQEFALGGIRMCIEGEGDPTLLFVHGFGCSLEDWTAQVSMLSPCFRCVALDLPGHGSSAWPEQTTMVALADAVNAAKEHTGGRSVVLVGHSLGAKIIREAYSRSRLGVAGLVFIEGAYYDGDGDALVGRAQDAVDKEGFVAFAQAHFGAMFIEGSDPGFRAYVLARVHAMDPVFARALYLEAVRWDSLRGRDTLSQIDVPVLLLQSTYNDASFQRRALQSGMQTPFMEQVARLVPQATIQVIEGHGHFVPVEAVDTVNQALRAFANGIAETIR